MSASVRAEQHSAGGVLRRYVDHAGDPREIVIHRTVSGAALVVDRAALDADGGRLIAHLAADEPAGNAALACEHFLAEPPQRRACRRLTVTDLLDVASSRLASGEGTVVDTEFASSQLLATGGARYAIKPVEIGISIPALRWCLLADGERPHVIVSLREVVARAEAYQPAYAVTRRVLDVHAGSRSISTAILRAELHRLCRSRIVLNRGLREAVLAAVARRDVSMSEIAMRCGRQKRDSRGNVSGETSWLSRRLGLLPEGGCSRPTPWIHSDVLAVIARCGLGVSPREVEL